MTMNKNLLLIGMIILFFISCKENTRSMKIDSDKDLEIVINDIKKTQELEKVEYEFVGIPDYDTKENPKSVIRIKLYNIKISDLNKESIGKEIAKRVFQASNKTRTYGTIWIEFINSNELGVINSKITRNFVFKTLEL